MTDQYTSTQDQVNKELGEMYRGMRDPERQEQKELENNHKKNVGNTTKRYGLD